MNDRRASMPGAAARPRRDGDYWRGIADLYGDAGDDAGEFPPGADLPLERCTRRGFMGLLSASMALAGLGGCSAAPDETIVPYVRQPGDVIAGRPRHYATTMTLDGHGIGLVVESHEGRPTKMEGNPDHPASLGACGVFEQASLLQLYDPDRAGSARHRREPCLWHAAIPALAARLGVDGRGLCVLIEPSASPTMAAQLSAMRTRWPAARMFVHDPLARGPHCSAAAAARTLFGRAATPRGDLARARVILTLDADPLASGPWQLRHARAFAAGRRAGPERMTRLYAAESTPTCTGTSADHRLRVRDREIVALALALVQALTDIDGVRLPDQRLSGLLPVASASPHAAWIKALAADLAAHRGECLVLVGERQPAAAHALGHLLNAMLGNVGATLAYDESPLIAGDGDLHGLADLLAGGEVGALLILGGNPVRTAPGDVDLAALLARAGTCCHLGMYENETAACCEWFVPQAHYLESWGDARAYDGTASLQQPLIEPLGGGRTAAEMLEALLGGRRGARDLMMSTWAAAPRPAGVTFPGFIAQCLRRGVIAEPPRTAPAMAADWSRFPRLDPRTDDGPWEVSLHADAKVHDGRFANNPWLQELPDPITKLTWDNAARVSPRSARELGIATGDLIEVRCGTRALAVPAVVLPGQADGSIALALGYGRSGAELTAAGVGVDAYPLRTRDEPWTIAAATVRRLDGSRRLAITQQHWSLEGRPIVRERGVGEPAAAPSATSEPSLRPAAEPAPGPQWAMVVDLNACNGCSACVIACQAENNIPVVGRENVLRSREMHWLRVDRYYRGDEDDPVALSQPMACQHCEKAPCEYVCPTYATTHSSDGLNEMTYNRCVGTRFCSNNCPYKVRRFNWYNFADGGGARMRMARNPEVTVRARGVMEKCTYCVQRIRGAEHLAAAEGVALRTDQVVTACQQTCPAQAIVFGDMADPLSAVARLRASQLAYAVLEDTGAQPRTRYLERIRNPNPELA